MVAKSEASMPVSSALAKLAVATDLGTAARPSTSGPLHGTVANGGKAAHLLVALARQPSLQPAGPRTAAQPPAAAPPNGTSAPPAAAPTPRLPPLRPAAAPGVPSPTRPP
ncbi:hypothetical protein TSOC_003528, partial [Tetrabaena socialis]